MKLESKIQLAARREQVWAAMNDPQVLAVATPGCKEFTQTGPDQFAAVMEMGVAGIKGRYKGQVSIAERQPPESYRLMIEGTGTPGYVKASMLITLAEASGGTELTYNGDAQVGGMVASVGQRMLGGVAKMVIDQFFKAIEKAAINLNA